MKTLLIAVLLIATPAMAQDQPVHILNTGEGTGVMNYIASDGQIKSQIVIIDNPQRDTYDGSTNLSHDTLPGLPSLSLPNLLD